MQIIDKNNNPIHTATAIWALGQVIKTPEEPMIAFIRSIKPSDKDSQKELELLLAKWQL